MIGQTTERNLDYLFVTQPLEAQGVALERKGDVKGARAKYIGALFENDREGFAGECVRILARLDNAKAAEAYANVLRKHWKDQGPRGPERTKKPLVGPLDIARQFYDTSEAAA